MTARGAAAYTLVDPWIYNGSSGGLGWILAGLASSAFTAGRARERAQRIIYCVTWVFGSSSSVSGFHSPSQEVAGSELNAAVRVQIFISQKRLCFEEKIGSELKALPCPRFWSVHGLNSDDLNIGHACLLRVVDPSWTLY